MRWGSASVTSPSLVNASWRRCRPEPEPSADGRITFGMSPEPSGLDIALRLAAAVVAGGAIGLDRSERGRSAGLRTTMLVCLAAALAMAETNLLLSTHGKGPDSFVQIDPMRLPLGILSGIGFIGAGAILRRGEMIRGVTTAATLWLTTVIGLVLGSG